MLSGGVAGLGAAYGGKGGAGTAALAALAFVAASILTTAVLNLFSVRTFSHRKSKERKIIYNESLGSLELMVPLLIRRVQDAGLAPVFVVDELDKVRDLDVRMEALLRQPKHLVADKAFCCFLVDRSYFEKVRGWNAEAGHPTGLTFFGENLYVIVHHRDWHGYLEKIIVENEEKVPYQPEAVMVLRRVLLARSKMHAIDLRREIETLRRKPGSDAELDINPTEVIALPWYLNRFFYQVAVEFLLRDPALAERIDSDPAFLQVAYDALYYLLRKWEQFEDADWSLAALDSYLALRMDIAAK